MNDGDALAEARAHGFTFEPKTASGTTDFEVTLRGIPLGSAPRSECFAFARGISKGLAWLRDIGERPRA